MIRLTCTSCKATLEMDEAFAGGVCRCQHCGTIQTVPAHLKSTAAVPAPAYAPQPAPYPPGGAPSSGLDQLADVVASSGLSRRSLTDGGRRGPAVPVDPYAGYGAHAGYEAQAGHAQQGGYGDAAPLGYQPPRERPRKSPMPLILGIAGGAVLLVIAGILWFRASSAPAPVTGTGTGVTPGPTGIRGSDANPVTPTPAPGPTFTGPRFTEIPLTGAGKVVYVLDRGDASKSLLDPLKAALYDSLESVGPGTEFQVIFWKRSADDNLKDGSYPDNKTAKATPDQIDAVRRKFEDLTASGRTEIDDAIKAAMARKPDAIVIATPKGDQLDDDWLKTVEQARGNARTKIHVLALGSPGANTVLKAIASKTGGKYVEMSERQLRAQ